MKHYYLIEITGKRNAVCHGPYCDAINQSLIGRAWIDAGRTIYWLDSDGPAQVGRFTKNDGTVNSLPFASEASK